MVEGIKNTSVRAADETFRPHDFVLAGFTPYRIVALGDAFARALSRQYKDADITTPEWRVLAVIGGAPGEEGGGSGMAARDVVSRTPLDKMAVSRAITSLEDKGLILRRGDPDDRRVTKIVMSCDGRVLFDRIVRIAVALEQSLLSVLSVQERSDFLTMLSRLEVRALEEFGD